MREGDEVVVNVAALDLGLGSGGFDVVHVNLTRGLEAQRRRRRARDEAQLHLAPAPGRPGRGVRWRDAASVGKAHRSGRRRCRSWSCRCTGIWRRRPGRRRRPAPGLKVGYVQTGGRGAAGLALARRRRAARARPALRPHHRGARLRRRARGAQHRRRARRRRRRLGWDAVLVGPGPGDHRLGHRVRPRRHGRPRQRPRGALPRPADPALAAALLGATRASATAASATTPTPCSNCCSPRSRSRCPRATSRTSPPSSRTPRGERHHAPPERTSTSTATPPPACRRTTMGRTLDEDPLFFAAPLAAGTLAGRPAASAHGPLRRRGLRAPGREPAVMAIAVKPPSPAAHRGGRRRRALRGPRPRLPLLPGAGARPLAQHAQRLPHRPAPVRRVPRRARARRARRRARPTSPTSSPSWRPATATARLLGRRRSTARPPACAPSTSTCAATS